MPLFTRPISADTLHPQQRALAQLITMPIKEKKNNNIHVANILSKYDIKLYQKIFTAQKSGLWKKADSHIKRVNNTILMGHVMAQRYLHPTKYRSKYSELKNWMKLYSDHPDARRLYKLALRRKPKNWKPPTHPRKTYKSALINKKYTKTTIKQHFEKKSAHNRRIGRKLKKQFSRTLRKGHTLVAKNFLNSKNFTSRLSRVEIDRLRARLAHAYFIDKRDQWAIMWAKKAIDRSGKYIPEAYWTAGLANWRLKNKEKSRDYFSKAALIAFDDNWLHSAAAFWASRSFLATGKPEKVIQYLEIAAQHPRTFYGIIAANMLGKKNPFDWKRPGLKNDHIREILDTSNGKRAIALMQVNEFKRAERELLILINSAKDQSVLFAILDIVILKKMASLSMLIDDKLFPNGKGFDRAAYPIPIWEPTHGFKIDRALIYALMRQESKFNPKAKSWAGARGLMQLMPRTASFIARDQQYHLNKKNKLYGLRVNLELGQKYLKILLNDPKIGNDLFLLAVAWNGGPGNLNKWLRRNSYTKDPLFLLRAFLHEKLGISLRG